MNKNATHEEGCEKGVGAQH